jgi:hypothetical protein
MAKQKAKSSGHKINTRDLLEITEGELEIQRQKRLEEEARKARVVARVSWKSAAVDPFSVLSLRPAKPRGWDSGKTLSEKQRGVLKKAGINPDGIPYAQGKQLVTEIISRWQGDICSFGQAKILKRYGYPTNLTFSQARATIDAISAAGWKRPASFVIPDPVKKETIKRNQNQSHFNPYAAST